MQDPRQALRNRRGRKLNAVADELVPVEERFFGFYASRTALPMSVFFPVGFVGGLVLLGAWGLSAFVPGLVILGAAAMCLAWAVTRVYMVFWNEERLLVARVTRFRSRNLGAIIDVPAVQCRAILRPSMTRDVVLFSIEVVGRPTLRLRTSKGNKARVERLVSDLDARFAPPEVAES